MSKKIDHTFKKKPLETDEEKKTSASNSTKKSAKKSVKKRKKRVQKKVKKQKQSEETMILDETRKKSIDDDLRQIYSDKNGDLPDMTTFQTKNKRSVLRAILVLFFSLACLSAVAWFGFFTFDTQANFSERDVIVSVNGPEQIAIGDSIRYRIKYTNDQSVPLTQSTLQVRYPAGFIFSSSSVPAVDENNTTWQLGAIDERSGGVIEIYGNLYGDINTEQSLRAFFNYTPANFSSEFQKVETLSTAFTKANTEISLTGPETIGVGIPGTWTITVVGEPVQNEYILEVVYPENFTVVETTPESTTAEIGEWILAANTTTQTIKIEGIFQKNISGVLTANILQSIENSEINRITIASTQKDISVSETDIVANLLINGAIGDFALQAGDTLNSTIVVQNTGELPMDDVSVRFVIDGPSDGKRTIFSWQSLTDVANGAIVGDQRSADTRRGTITWNASKIAALKKIEPGEEVQIPFTLPILTSEQEDLTKYVSFIAAASASIEYMQDGTKQTANTNPMDITINSDLRFDTEQSVEMTDDGQVHTIIYALKNTFHELKDIRVHTDIYGSVDVGTLTVGAGDATFDKESGTLSWNIDQMSLSQDIYPLEFTVTLLEKNPTQTNLTSKVRITATDVITGKEITLVGSEIFLEVVEELPPA